MEVTSNILQETGELAVGVWLNPSQVRAAASDTMTYPIVTYECCFTPPCLVAPEGSLRCIALSWFFFFHSPKEAKAYRRAGLSIYFSVLLDHNIDHIIVYNKRRESTREERAAVFSR